MGRDMFTGCLKLETLSIPSTLQSFDVGLSFEGCPIVNIVVNENNEYFCTKDGVLYNKDCTKIYYFFNAANSRTFEFPSSVVEIGSGAFDGCKFTGTYYLPSSLKW
jgi:hypothetical protein